MVIATGGWMQNASNVNQEKNMSATGILICHDNSYPFQERTLSLEQPIKIGRSVARARAANDNAIFDCKVLSRNHALLWYDCGKFYLKDTKSSNGTFVNNKRLSPSGESSIACEVCSGDVVQFGVEVVESTKKVTHGCIVATLKLYLPDGKEAKASFSNSVAYVNVTLEDLYKLNQFIQEAGRRENALRSKLEYMQQLLEHTRIATNQSWKALVLEDCLLSRLEMLESQVVAYSKNFGEDKLRTELFNLLEDRAQYQSATKELLQKKVLEKREIISKVQGLKCRLSETEEETQRLHNAIKDSQNELQELAIKYIKIQQTLQDTTEKLNKTKNKLKEAIQQSEKEKQELTRKLEDQKSIERNLQICLRDYKLDTVHIHKQISALRNYMQTLQDIKFASNESFNFKDHANPIDAINIILSKWNSMYVEISDNDTKMNEDQSANQINPFDNDLKFKKSFCIDNNLSKNEQPIDLSTLEYNQYKYILPPVTSKTLIMSNSTLGSTNLESQSKTEFFNSQAENSINLITEREFDLNKQKNSISVSEIYDNNDDEKENSTSVKLIMRFSSDDDSNKQILKNDNFETKVNCFDSKTLITNPLSTQIIKVTRQISNMLEMNRNLLPKQLQSKIEQIYLQNNYEINTIEPVNKNNFITSNCSQELILQNVMHSLESLKINNGNGDYNIVQELQHLRNWFLHESNDVIIDQFKKYYHQIQSQTHQAQELSEQLVILKEKYNSIIEERTNVIKKHKILEAQCKDIINATYMVPIYYIIPILFALIWMSLEKILY